MKSIALRAAAFAAVALLGVPPATAGNTSTSQSVNCDYGQSGSALFTEGATSATWTYYGKWQHKNGTTANSQSVGWTAPKGTHRIRSVYDSKWKLLSIHVHSSGTVSASGGQQCASACSPSQTGSTDRDECTDPMPELPVEGLPIPPLPPTPACAEDPAACNIQT